MTAVEIIEEIKRLPEAEQNRVIQFARNADENRQLSPDELGKLAREMVEAKDPAEADRLKEEIVRGFYGGQSHAENPSRQTARTSAGASFDADASTRHFA
jgi:hypothetical protein